MWKVELIKIDFNLLCLLCSIFMKNSLLSSLNFVAKCYVATKKTWYASFQSHS